LLSFGVAIFALSIACSSDDPTVERRGGPLPPDGAAGKVAAGSGGEDNLGGSPPSGNSGAAGDASSGALISFCDALAVMQAKCQRCHGDPRRNGAPVPFLTYEDTQAQYGSSGVSYADVMSSVVESDIMPYVILNEPPTSLMPPVEPLTVEEKATLLGWLEQGAKPEGGTDCP
jgi:hypothetical protein